MDNQLIIRSTKALALAGMLYLIVFGASCALLAPLPSNMAVRDKAAQVTGGLVAAVFILDKSGELVDKTPLPTSVKDALDCATLQVVGHDAPSQTVLRICGTVPTLASSPIGQAVSALKVVASNPSLCSVIAAVMAKVNPLIEKFKAARVDQVASMLDAAVGIANLALVGCQ